MTVTVNIQFSVRYQQTSAFRSVAIIGAPGSTPGGTESRPFSRNLSLPDFKADGSVIYRNRTVLLVRTKWGKIIKQEDYYEDTARIGDFDRRLREIEAGRSCGTVVE